MYGVRNTSSRKMRWGSRQETLPVESCTINASHGITLLLKKKHSFVSNIGFYYQKKKFKVFFWCDLGGHWIVGYISSSIIIFWFFKRLKLMYKIFHSQPLLGLHSNSYHHSCHDEEKKDNKKKKKGNDVYVVDDE